MELSLLQIGECQNFAFHRIRPQRAATVNTTGTSTGAVIGDVRDVSGCIECDGLVARVVARHVALTAVDAHVLRNYSDSQQ